MGIKCRWICLSYKELFVLDLECHMGHLVKTLHEINVICLISVWQKLELYCFSIFTKSMVFESSFVCYLFFVGWILIQYSMMIELYT